MSQRFYRDLGDTEVERLARAVCVRRGSDPDTPVPDNGYADAPLIPLWWKFQVVAVEFLAMQAEWELMKAGG